MGCCQSSSSTNAQIPYQNNNVGKQTVRVKRRVSKMDQKTSEVFESIKDIPIIQMLSQQQKIIVARQLEECEFKAGETLMKEGEVGKDFFLMKSGSCEVFVDGNKVSELKAGDYFGEQALLSNSSKRTATVKAKENIVCLVMDKDAFDSIVKSSSIKFFDRTAKLALTEEEEDLDELSTVALEINPELASDVNLVTWLVGCVKTNLLFQDLKTKDIETVVKHMVKRNIQKNGTIIEQGDTEANEFFVVDSGEFEIERDQVIVDNIARGACVGELALVYEAPRNATIRSCSETASVWVLSRQVYKKLTKAARKNDFEATCAFLRKVPLLGSLYSSEIALMARALSKVEFTGGTTIFQQGDEGDKFYMIMQGKVQGYEKREDGQQKHFELAEGEWFGEIALKYDKPRTATIAADGKVVCLAVSRNDFNTLFGPLDQLMERQLEEYQRPQQSDKEYRQNLMTRALDDLEQGPTVGRGKYGVVKFMRDPQSGAIYALKSLNKAWVPSKRTKQSKRRINALYNERNVMRELSSELCPFIVKLWGTYKDANFVHFLMEGCTGGDFFKVLKTRGYVDEKTAQFYIGCLIEALDHIHSHDMIHRDLKPENIVMDARGYAKLTDFGFTKKLGEQGKTYTLCGTPGYMAPEVILGQGYGKAADWFSLGCVLYDMLTGAPPFPTRADQVSMLRQMMQNKLHLPMYLSFWAKDLICQMLKIKPVKRLGVIRGGADRLREHPWFEKFDWNALRAGTLDAPIQPLVDSNDPMAPLNFDRANLEEAVLELQELQAQYELPEELINWDINF